MSRAAARRMVIYVNAAGAIVTVMLCASIFARMPVAFPTWALFSVPAFIGFNAGTLTGHRRTGIPIAIAIGFLVSLGIAFYVSAGMQSGSLCLALPAIVVGSSMAVPGAYLGGTLISRLLDSDLHQSCPHCEYMFREGRPTLCPACGKVTAQCPECGFDLRASGGRGCPECGWNRDADKPAAETP